MADYAPVDGMRGYVTKDSGEREVFSTGMQRDTQAGKPRYDLCWAKGVAREEQLLTRWARLMARGAEKYSDRNWQKARTEEELDRAHASAFRHFMAWFAGEEDEDHGAAIIYNIMLAEYIKGRLDGEG